MIAKFAFSFWVLLSTVFGFAQESPNVLRFSPLGDNEIGNTFGIEYERNLKDKPVFSFIAPVEYVHQQIGGRWMGRSNLPYFFFRPGVKLYTAFKEKVSRYALGFNFVVGYGQINRETGSYEIPGFHGKIDEYEARKNLKVGAMVTNYLNFEVGQNVTLGMYLGVGFYYYNKDIGYQKQEDKAAYQIGGNMGFRF